MDLINKQFPSTLQVAEQYLKQSPSQSVSYTPKEGSFEHILKQKQIDSSSGELKFSKHANGRLTDRNINLTNDQMVRLESGAKKAGEKGINESLVLMDQMAFIVNTKSNTVITAMKQNEASESIFTNIDGAVII